MVKELHLSDPVKLHGIKILEEQKQDCCGESLATKLVNFSAHVLRKLCLYHVLELTSSHFYPFA